MDVLYEYGLPGPVKKQVRTRILSPQKDSCNSNSIVKYYCLKYGFFKKNCKENDIKFY